MSIEGSGGADAGKSLLIVEDDLPFLKRLARAMERRGYDVHTAESAAKAFSQPG